MTPTPTAAAHGCAIITAAYRGAGRRLQTVALYAELVTKRVIPAGTVVLPTGARDVTLRFARLGSARLGSAWLGCPAGAGGLACGPQCAVRALLANAPHSTHSAGPALSAE